MRKIFKVLPLVISAAIAILYGGIIMPSITLDTGFKVLQMVLLGLLCGALLAHSAVIAFTPDKHRYVRLDLGEDTITVEPWYAELIMQDGSGIYVGDVWLTKKEWDSKKELHSA
jgi:hypothetical protein